MTIRRQPEDFRVDELLDGSYLGALVHEPSPQRTWALYRLEKVSLTTHEALAKLAATLGVRAGLLLAPGLKDKHARTTQHVGVPRRAWAAEASIAPKELDGPGWRADFLGWSTTEPSTRELIGNRFAIVVRGLSRDACERIDRHRTELVPPDQPNRLLFTNYFGDQRFGSARHGKGFAARALIDGDVLRALQLLIATPARKDTGSLREFTRTAAQAWGSWQELARRLPMRPERRAIESLASGDDPRIAFAELPSSLQQLALDAYQSFLWNAGARRLLATHVAHGTIYRAEDDFGPMLFAQAQTLPAELLSCVVAMPHHRARYSGHVHDAMQHAMRDEGIEISQLDLPWLRGAAFATHARPLLAAADEVACTPPERDELANARSPNCWRRTLTMTLPPGAFATVVLRALGE